MQLAGLAGNSTERQNGNIQ